MDRVRGALRACLLIGFSWAPLANAATMQLAGTNVGMNVSVSVPLTVNSGTNTLGDYALTVSFDTNVLQFVDVNGGDGVFSSKPNLINATVPGQVSYVHQPTAASYPTGAVLVSRIVFNTIGAPGSSSTLAISEAVADNADGVALPVTSTTNGSVGILFPPQLAVSPDSRDYGAVVIGQTNALPFQIVNTGGQSLTGTATVAAPFQVNAGSPYNLAPGQTGTVTVSFIPVASGSVSNGVVFASNGGVSTNTVLGTGLTPGQLGISPVMLDFGTIATGTTAQASFAITNTGGASVSGTATLSSATFTIVSGSPFTLGGFGATNVVVQFSPTTAGNFGANVIFSSTGGTSTNAIGGVGAIVPVAAFSGSPTRGLAPLPVTFADASTGTITNRFWSFGDGGTTNTLSTNVVHVYTLAGTNTVTLIASGPVGASTNTKPNLVVVTNIPPILAVSPSTRDFGSVVIGQTNSLPFSLINQGQLTMTGTATVAGPFAVSGGIPYSVAGGQTGTVNVSFMPVSTGAFSNRVVFTSSGGVSSNLVTGVGLTPGALGVSPSSLQFGVVATGATVQASFVVTNTGGASVSGTAQANGLPFAVVSGSPFVLAGFGGTNVVISFSPTSDGTFNSNVVFASTGGNSTNAVSGTGAIAPVAMFSGSPTNGLVPLSVTFADNSTGTITNRFWSFGDGGTTNLLATSVVHTYTGTGTNDVTLIVSGPLGASTNILQGYVVVTNVPAPLADFTAAPMVGQVPLTVVFSNLTAGSVGSFQWSFGDGASSALANPTHAYTNAGTFTVGLTAFGPGGTNTQTKASFITVTNGPVQELTLTVHIVSPTNGQVVADRMVDVTGNGTLISSVLVTNSRGGTTEASFEGDTNWIAGGVGLRLGTNRLFAVGSDTNANLAIDAVTVVRINTNYVNTTLRATKVTLVLGATTNSDQVSFTGVYNPTVAPFNPSNDTLQVMFGDYESLLIPSNSLVKLKYKSTNSLTAFALVTKSRGVTFQASRFTLTNGQPFLVAVALGTNDLGPDALSFPGLTNDVGKFAWSFGKQMPAVDQFFLGKSKLTTNTFQLAGNLFLHDKPNVLTNAVSFGIGSYDETLATNGWKKGVGNVYTYARPVGKAGAVTSMTLNFDLGTWTAKGAGANLSFLLINPSTDVRLEVADFAASYPALLTRKGTSFSY